MDSNKKYQWYKVAENIADIKFSVKGLGEIKVANKIYCIALHQNVVSACTQKCPHAGGILSS